MSRSAYALPIGSDKTIFEAGRGPIDAPPGLSVAKEQSHGSNPKRRVDQNLVKPVLPPLRNPDGRSCPGCRVVGPAPPRPPGEGLNGAATGDPATGLAWVVQEGPLGREWAHTGALGGSTASLLLRNDEGLTLAFVANTLPADVVGFVAALRAALTGAATAIESWPDIDLFETGA